MNTGERRALWPALGLVFGSSLGLVVGLLAFPDVFFLGMLVGAGAGLVIGMIANQHRG
jgi:hypothetical protein